MSTWKIATVQMDCKFADKAANLETMSTRLREAAAKGAKLVIFPECAVPGYCFDSKAEAWPFAETLPGASTEVVGALCRQLGVWAAYGLLERDGDYLFNSCALVGPDGFKASYRKAHLPCLGIDRFVTPGDRPFAVHDLGGLRVGMNICYDFAFPEAARVLMLLGADLIILPTNWPDRSLTSVQYIIQARAVENNIFYAACNRVGEEQGFRFMGRSRIVDVTGDMLAESDDNQPTILYADIDPARARDKHIVRIPGLYELHRTKHRRPELYGPLCASKGLRD
jgi:predicted amidohydrolase